MANAEDFTYSKGYLGLLSALGASLGITFCCATAVPVVYRQWRAAFLKHASKTTHVNEPSLPMTEDHPTQTHGRSKRWGIAVKLIQRYQQTKAFPESVSGADHIDEETPAAASESPDISLPMTVDDATQTHCRSEPRDVYVTITYDTSKALLERVPRAVSTDDSNPAAAAKNPDEILLPTTEDKANETPGRIARRSIDGCAAGAKPPPCGGLQRHRTF